MHNRRFCVVIAVLLLTACAEDGSPGRPSGPVQLLRAGQSQHSIVLQEGASPSERHAAEELQRSFEAATGVQLPVVEGAPPGGGPMIVLGDGPTTRGLGVLVPRDELGEQGFLLQTAAPHVVIAGTPQVGTLYGVHRFLEKHLGVRWYAPGVTHTPRVTDLSLAPVRRVDRPAFRYRYTSYQWPGADTDFRTRVGDNQGTAGADDPRGRRHDLRGTAHTYHRYVHPNDYFDAHPEYFSEIGGVRRREETQLNLTHPDVLDIVTEKMLEELRRKPDTEQLTFSQMDYYNQCECDDCRALNERYGSLGGTQFWFVNQLAERIAPHYPNVLIRTLAYTYTEEPPRDMRMHPNVAVWLCHMYPSCDSHPVTTCPLDADYQRRARRWAEITDHLYVWHYSTNFIHYYMPFPNLRALAADMRFYRDIGVEGVFLQGMGHRGGGGEFSLLRPWYGLKLLWDPDQDPGALIDDFLQGYYGAAGQPIRKYIDLLHDKVERENIHMHLYTNPGQGYLTDVVVEASEELFDEAEAAVADDAELLERVRVARMPLVYSRFFPRNGYEIRGKRLVWRDKLAGLAEVSRFLQRMQDHGFETYREFNGHRDTLMLIYMILNATHVIQTIESPFLEVDVVPTLAGRALRIVDKASGECVTAYDRKQVLHFPFCGGLEDRTGDLSSYYGWIEPATVVARSPNSITVGQDTLDGLRLQRQLTLDMERPLLQVVSTLTNPSNREQKVRLRNHIELDLGELRDTRVRFADLDGALVDTDMTDVIAGLRLGEHYRARRTPAGQWSLVGSKGIEFVQRFDNADVDFTWLYAYPETLGQLDLEVWGHRTVLASGASVELRHEIEIRPADF